METVQITLTIKVDPGFVSHPATWRWSDVVLQVNRDGAIVTDVSVTADSSQSGHASIYMAQVSA